VPAQVFVTRGSANKVAWNSIRVLATPTAERKETLEEMDMVAMVDEVKSGMRKVETILVEASDPGTKKTGKALDLPLDASCGRYWIFLQFYHSLQLSGI
jgi:hypothetical protein